MEQIAAGQGEVAARRSPGVGGKPGFALTLEIFFNQPPAKCAGGSDMSISRPVPRLVAIVMNWRGAAPRLMSVLSILLGLVFLVGFFIADLARAVRVGHRAGTGGMFGDRLRATCRRTVADGPVEQAAGDPIVQGPAVAPARTSRGACRWRD